MTSLERAGLAFLSFIDKSKENLEAWSHQAVLGTKKEEEATRFHVRKGVGPSGRWESVNSRLQLEPC